MFALFERITFKLDKLTYQAFWGFLSSIVDELLAYSSLKKELKKPWKHLPHMYFTHTLTKNGKNTHMFFSDMPAALYVRSL